MFFKNRSKLNAILKVVEREDPSRGILKRLDENRELMVFLQQRAPEVLQRSPWVEHWIKGHDEFLVDLAAACEVETPENLARRGFPRPWPDASTGRVIHKAADRFDNVVRPRATKLPALKAGVSREF